MHAWLMYVLTVALMQVMQSSQPVELRFDASGAEAVLAIVAKRQAGQAVAESETMPPLN